MRYFTVFALLSAFILLMVFVPQESNAISHQKLRMAKKTLAAVAFGRLLVKSKYHRFIPLPIPIPIPKKVKVERVKPVDPWQPPQIEWW